MDVALFCASGYVSYSVFSRTVALSNVHCHIRDQLIDFSAMAFGCVRLSLKQYLIILVLLEILLFVYFWVPATVLNVHKKRKFHNTRTPNSSILVLYWTSVFGHVPNLSEKPFDWPFLYVGKNCPVRCEVSNNRSRVAEASALVMHGSNIHELPTASDYIESIPWIFHVNENPVYLESVRNKAVMGKFNYLANYRLDSDFPCPEFRPPDMTKPVPFGEKSGLVIAVYSHCEDTRTLYMFRLMKYLAIDSYGDCLQNKPRIPGGKNATKLVMRRYKFTLAFPNADCDYYMTEKIYNALSAGSVPVWMGTDKIDEVLQWGNLKHSIIKVKDFPSPRKLAEYLLYLSGNEAEYNKYLKWKYEGFKFPPEYYKTAVGEWWDGLPLYCRICMRIAKDPWGHDGLAVDRCDGEQRRTLEK